MMSIIRILSFVVLFLVSSHSFAFPSSASSGQISVIAKVDNQIITNADIIERYKIISKLSKIKANSLAEQQTIFSQLLQKMIDEELQIKEAKNLEIEVDQEKFADVKDDIAKDLHQSPESLENFFRDNGISYDSFMKQIEAQILWSDIVRRIVAPKIKVAQSEIDELVELRKIKTTLEKYLIAEIFIPSQDDDQVVDSKTLATKLFDELKSGKDFDKIAKQFSRSATSEFGGEVGWIGEGDVDNKIYKTVSNIKVGEVTRPIEMQDGYYLFKVLQKKSFNTLSAQDNEQLNNIVYNKKLQLSAKGYLMDLKKNAYIEIDRKALERIE